MPNRQAPSLVKGRAAWISELRIGASNAAKLLGLLNMLRSVCPKAITRHDRPKGTTMSMMPRRRAWSGRERWLFPNLFAFCSPFW